MSFIIYAALCAILHTILYIKYGIIKFVYVNIQAAAHISKSAVLHTIQHTIYVMIKGKVQQDRTNKRNRHRDLKKA